jgi:hypothetical protein
MISIAGQIHKVGTQSDGQILIGSNISQPISANITSTGGTINISNGHNTINLEVADVSDTFIQLITTNGTSVGGQLHWTLETSSLKRWIWELINTESGSNTGSDLYLQSYNDSGTLLYTVLQFLRKSGVILIGDNGLQFPIGNYITFESTIGHQISIVTTTPTNTFQYTLPSSTSGTLLDTFALLNNTQNFLIVLSLIMEQLFNVLMIQQN